MDTKIIEFLLFQNQLTQVRKINSFFRGDNLANVYKRYGIIYDNTEENRKELLKRIFLIGDKAKYFYNASLFSREINSRNIKLTDEDEITLFKIFDEFNGATKSKKEYIIDYFKRNKALFQYFENKENKIHFTKSIKSSPNPLSYRNYYLKILHQLYYIKYRYNSHFVSTSRDKEVTKNFSGNRGLIIHCWQPNFYFYRKTFEILNLPKQDSPAFKEQKEFTFWAGILPHYISAIEFIDDNKIYFNPQISQSKIDIDLFYNGLDIDQTDFIEIIINTKFRKYFTKKGLDYTEKNACR